MIKKLHNDLGEVNILLLSTLMLGLSTIIFAVLAVISFGTQQSATSTLNSAKSASYKQGQSDQQKTDQKATLVAGEQPFRDYRAPDFYGNFDLKFPKNWNAYVIEDQSSEVQVNLTLNPDAVKQVASTQVNKYAFRAKLINKPEANLLAEYTDLLKTKKVTQQPTSVSGIGGVWIDGQLDTHRNGVVVLIPVRDKTLEFITDTHDYLPEFNQILAQSTIVK